MNTVSLVGRLATDPHHSEATGDRKARTWFVLAVDRPRSDEADFIPVTCFGKVAGTVANHVDKGRQVAVTGHVHASQWESDDGKERTVEVIAERVEFLGRKPVNGPSSTDAASPADADLEPA